MKTQTVTLEYPATFMPVAVGEERFKGIDYKAFRVTRVTDSVEYHPGQVLRENEVSRLCRDNSWKVTVVCSK